MRDVFANTLIELAKEDKKLVLLMAEVGYGVVESFENKYPNRFYNTGISEQNLVLTACGLAMQGMHPVAYSMSSFLPTRAFEMIKDAVCYQDLPVTLVGIGSGISYGKLGSTHHAPEEYALMNCLPNMRLIFPANGDECRAALRYATNSKHPCYIGLEKCRARVENNDLLYDSSWKKYCDINNNQNVSIIAVGYLLEMANRIKEELSKDGINCSVYSAQTLKPLDENAINDACMSKNIFILEEHYKCGGLGTSIAQYILESNLAQNIKHFETIGLRDEFLNCVYDEQSILSEQGLCVGRIVECIKEKI